MSPLPLDAEVAALEQGLDDCDPFELDRRLRRAVEMEARNHARIASLLSHVVVWGLHRDLGFRSVDAYAEERLAMAPSRARALLRIECAARVCPPLRAAFAEGRLSWVQAHALVPLLLEPGAARHREGWVEHAQRVSVRRLGDDVERALALADFAPPPLTRNREEIDADSDTDPAGLQTVPTHGSKKTANGSSSAPRPSWRSCSARCWPTVQRRIERIRGRPCRPSDALVPIAPRLQSPEQPDHDARGTTSAACTGTSCAAPASRRAACASSSVCGRMARRSRFIALGR